LKKKSLKLGIIGLGGIGLGSLKMCLEDDLIEPVAGADVSAQQRKKAEQFLKAQTLFADYRQMMREVPMDAVFIATPNALHAPPAVAAMKAGLEVLCEKPMADSLAAARRIYRTAQDTGRLFMVAQNQRFRADTMWLKQRIEEGLLGEVYAIHTRWVRRSGLAGGWFRQKKLSGGGPLIDLGVHVMDLALWLAGFPRPLRVSGQVGQYFCEGDVEDWAYGLVRLAGGGVLTCETMERGHIEREVIRVEIRGTEAGVVIDGGAGATIYTSQGEAQVDLKPQLDADWAGSRRREMHHFAECALSGRPTIIPVQQSVQVQAIIEGIYRSARQGKEVSLPRI